MKTRLWKLFSFVMIPIVLIGVSIPTTSTFAQPTSLSPNPAIAHVKLAHFAPFASTVDGTSVTIEIDGAPVIDNFKFGAITPNYIDETAGVDLLVKVYPSGNPTPIITQTVNLLADTFYTIAVIGNGTSYSLKLVVLTDDVTRPASGAKVRIADFVPYAINFDICTTDNVVVPGLSNLGYESVTSYIPLPAGVYNLKIAAYSKDFPCAVKLYDVPQLTLIDFTVVTAFANGDIFNANLPVNVFLRWEQPPILNFLPVINQ